MKKHLLKLFLIVLLLQGVRVAAAGFSVLHHFGGDGAGFNPVAPLISGPDGTLYGTASTGPGFAGGTVFKIQPDGSGLMVLKYFTNVMEGFTPQAGLVLSGGVLYGTTSTGGSNSSYGTVFQVNTDGGSFTNLHYFTGSDGAQPVARLVLSGGVLYGTTEYGGNNNAGTVFKLNSDGTGFTNLWKFSQTKTNGANPVADLLLVGGTLYGATKNGNGQAFYGTLFKLNTDGSGFTNFFNMPSSGGGGQYPAAGLVLSGNTLYGTTEQGIATLNGGTVFQVNTDGSGFNYVHTFAFSDGAVPICDLVLSGTTLYGTTEGGGVGNSGTLFRVNTDGNGFTNFSQFSGGNPNAGLVLVGGTLYGTTIRGGGKGSLFSINTNGGGFNVFFNFHDDDGMNPYAGLALTGSTLFGTTPNGGTDLNGSVFRVNTDGSGYTNIYNFTGGNDGSTPLGALVVDGNTLYGTTEFGGTNSNGAVFRLNRDGTSFTNLHSFNATDGRDPSGALLLAGSTLYGTTQAGGAADNGTVFRLNVDGTGFTNLYVFSAEVSSTNSDGAYPYCGLVLSGDTLYGTAANGGALNFGTVFKLNTNGTGFAALHYFDYAAYPESTLVLSGSTLYGTASGQGNPFSSGTVFELNTDGTGFTNLYVFQGYDGSGPAGLILSGNKLYGATHSDSVNFAGKVFQLNTDGSGFTNLYSFTKGSPDSGPILAGNTLYGTAQYGGMWGEGVVYALPLSAVTPVPLTIQKANQTVILSWTNAAFSLYAAPVVTGVYTNVPNATSPYTNPISGPQKFYRLSQ